MKVPLFFKCECFAAMAMAHNWTFSTFFSDDLPELRLATSTSWIATRRSTGICIVPSNEKIWLNLLNWSAHSIQYMHWHSYPTRLVQSACIVAAVRYPMQDARGTSGFFEFFKPSVCSLLVVQKEDQGGKFGVWTSLKSLSEYHSLQE